MTVMTAVAAMKTQTMHTHQDNSNDDHELKVNVNALGVTTMDVSENKDDGWGGAEYDDEVKANTNESEYKSSPLTEIMSLRGIVIVVDIVVIQL